MKHKLCSTIDEDNLYGNGWHNENDDKNDTRLKDKKDQTERNSTYKGCIIEYLLVCTKCEEQTGYKSSVISNVVIPSSKCFVQIF